MSVFTQNTILPTAQVIFQKVGLSAHRAFIEIPQESKDFYWIKVKILNYSKMNDVQQLYLGKNTTHIHGFLQDVRYLEFLNIKFEVCHIVCSRGVINRRFQLFCKKLIELKGKSKLYSKLCKYIGLFGLGCHNFDSIT